MSGAASKITTGLTGLAVARNPNQSLKVLYEKILKVLQKMPEDAGYRRNTQELVQGRLSIVKSTTDVGTVEHQINCGQAEELILQAERELDLARKMVQWKPWEPLVGEAPKNQWKWPMV